MAPEQARGEVTDKRADIWAFGVVLWEMLCGRRLFGGATTSETLAGVLRAEIDFGKLPAGTPIGIQKVLKRCLERDRKKRLRDIGDVRLEIEESLTDPVGEVLPTRRRLLPWVKPWLIAAASAMSLIAGLVAGGLYLGTPSLPDQASFRFTPFAFYHQEHCCPFWSLNGKAVAKRDRSSLCPIP